MEQNNKIKIPKRAIFLEFVIKLKIINPIIIISGLNNRGRILWMYIIFNSYLWYSTNFFKEFLKKFWKNIPFLLLFDPFKKEGCILKS